MTPCGTSTASPTTMSNPSGRKGTAWETAVVEYLKAVGWPDAERRRLSGALDRGDVAGVPGVMIEAKAERAITLAAYLTEVEAQTRNAGALVGVAWIKRRGKTSPADAYVVMTGATFTALLVEAGYRRD